MLDKSLKVPFRSSLQTVKPEWIEGDRLLLLEEGHCLRDQALAFCQLRQIDNLDTFGASSLSTIVQMVSNGMGLTLLPEISVAVEARHGDVQVIPFEAPEPSRTVGLAWRKSSPRRSDFEAIGEYRLKSIAQHGTFYGILNKGEDDR